MYAHSPCPFLAEEAVFPPLFATAAPYFVVKLLYNIFPYPHRRSTVENEVSACHFERRFDLCYRSGSVPLRGPRGRCPSNITDVACDHELAVGISVDTDEYVPQIPLMLHVIPDRQMAEPTLLRSPCLCGLFGLMPFEMAESTFFNGQAVYAACLPFMQLLRLIAF